MSPPKYAYPHYALLSDTESLRSDSTDNTDIRSRHFRQLRIPIILLLVSILSLILVFTPTNPQAGCTRPYVRPEWRTLSRAQKLSYLSAAQCLTRTPSPGDPNGTIHDTLSLIHSRVGNYSHNAAPFLPWHRLFVHIYEALLQEYCDYNGPMPYWDWTLDSQNLLASPIWNTDDGFGPSGSMSLNTDMRISVNGYCVTSGPFANYTPIYYEGVYHPHCLSRGFLAEETVKRVGDKTLRPDIIADIIRRERNYFDFLLGLERVSHSSIPYVVQGDFKVLTAPNDPVFYLHHAQVDRLWWSWQRVSPERSEQYNGPARNVEVVEARLDDVLDLGGLGLDLRFGKVTVRDVMNIEGGLLCYRYDQDVVY